MVQISVIIPVFNTGKYLEECLNSVINQTFTDFEIICVNDGSTDNSLDILNVYANKDERIIIISQENEGQGSARNNGLSKAKGDYIYFMDSDDIIKPNTLFDCYNEIKNHNLDLVMFQLINYDNETGKYYQDGHYDMPAVVEFVKDNIFSFEDLDDLIFKVAVSPVNKLYNKKFLDKLNVRFPVDIIFEDNIFFWKVFLQANKILFIPKHYYIRRRHSSSTTGAANLRFADTLEVHNRIFDIFKDFNLFEKHKKSLFNKKINLANLRFNQVENEVKHLFFETMKKDFNDMINEYSYENIICNLTRKNKSIINNVVNSKSHEEFELVMKQEELLLKNKKLKTKNKKLKKEITRYENENKLILTSNSWKITKPLRFVTNLLR